MPATTLHNRSLGNLRASFLSLLLPGELCDLALTLWVLMLDPAAFGTGVPGQHTNTRIASLYKRAFRPRGVHTEICLQDFLTCSASPEESKASRWCVPESAGARCIAMAPSGQAISSTRYLSRLCRSMLLSAESP